MHSEQTFTLKKYQLANSTQKMFPSIISQNKTFSESEDEVK